MRLIKGHVSFVILYVTEDLEFLVATSDVIEHKILATGPDVGDSSGHIDLLVQKFHRLGFFRVLLHELFDVQVDLEFMGVGVGLRVLLSLQDGFASVLEVGSRVKGILDHVFAVHGSAQLVHFGGTWLC